MPGPTISRTTLAKLTALCEALPEATVEPWYAHHNLRVRGKTFAWQTNNHHDDGRVAIHCKATHATQSMLVELDPARFFVPPYVGHKGWVGVRLEGGVDWKGLEGLLRDAYRMTAPKRLVAQLDGGTATSTGPRAPPPKRAGATNGAGSTKRAGATKRPSTPSRSGKLAAK